jgi:predicted CXXCH cytochrome family protein
MHRKKNDNFILTMLSKSTESLFILCIGLLLLLPLSSRAGVSGLCSNCHTMHNSQDGSAVAYDFDGSSFSLTDTPKDNLLIHSCLGCHSSTGTGALKDLPGGLKVPIVFNTSGYPTPALAGGNFYYVSLGGADNDAKGHNILSDDGNLNAAPGDTTGCTTSNSCHANLDRPYTGAAVPDSDGMNIFGRYACDGCHFRPKHHSDDHDHLVGGKVTTAAQGWYRFLSGHLNGLGYPHGVEGYEDGDWQYTSDVDDHNEYFGNEVNTSGGGFINLGHTTTAFCTGCHTEFHNQSGINSPFIRHPADVVIDNTGEYTNAFNAGGTGTGTYDPLIPVGRPVLPDTPDSDVDLNTDMVICLSCHRAHGSENFKMLRWDYRGWPGAGTNGCAMCHTSKQ